MQSKKLGPEQRREIDLFVRGGFYSKRELVQIFCEGMYEPGELPKKEVTAEIDKAFTKLLAAQKRWPAITDCDRLDRVFDVLNAQGIIALQNAGYTQSDGYDDVREEYAKRKKQQPIGYCFYHGQDLERAVAGVGLYLAFGPMDAKKEQTEGPRVGKLIVAALRDEGFEVKWDGSFAQRIFVTNLDWKKRVAAAREKKPKRAKRR